MSQEDCTDECAIMENKCVEKCENLLNKEDCKKLEYCTWFYLRHTEDVGKCIWKDDNNYSCSDIKRYSECFNGGDLKNLFNKCEYYKGKCREKCSLYISEERCIIDSDGDCLWMKNIKELDAIEECILKVCVKINFILFKY
jgi:hypothetical protein